MNYYKVLSSYSRLPQAFIKNNAVMNYKNLQLRFASTIPVVQYEEIKCLDKHPDILLIDVREPTELKETGQIPTSINIPLGNVGSALSDDLTNEKFKTLYGRNKPNKESPIIFHCKSGGRSEKASQLAVSLGYENVRNYKGSWLEWAEKENLS